MPDSYLLDTTILTALAQGDTTARIHLSSLDAADTVATCFIVVGEWEYGVLNVPDKKRRAQIRKTGTTIFAALTIWESTPDIALRYGAIHAELRAAGKIIPTNDIWIAATALVQGATVVTTDPHFQRIAGLRVVDWTQP